ncbi:MAG: hypothetical protein R3Y57_05650 [Erysipelotrichaceae bacterium]
MSLFSTITLAMTLALSPLIEEDTNNLSISYTEKIATNDVALCSTSSVKTYMSYSKITNTSSKQYHFIQNELTVDEESGLLKDKDGYIAVALGTYFGEIGTRYIFTLESGVELKLVKAEVKSDNHTVNGCYQAHDKSVIEFIVDTDYASDYFGLYSNGLILSGNFNNHEDFKGRITKIEEVSSETVRSIDSLLGESLISQVSKHIPII